MITEISTDWWKNMLLLFLLLVIVIQIHFGLESVGTVTVAIQWSYSHRE